MKIERHSQIIRLISQYDIETQEELAEKLNESGFQVTQATVSRDIRELKLTKISKPGGGSRYAAQGFYSRVCFSVLNIVYCGLAYPA